MPSIKEFEEVTEYLKKLELNLFRLVLTSFVFSLLAVLAQYDKFDWAFKALTEMIGGIMGVGGILSAYMSAIRHPMDEAKELLRSKPFLLEFKMTATFAFIAVMFYMFYVFASKANQVCLVFLALGVFTFFRGLARFILTIKQAEKRSLLWSKLSPEQRKGVVEIDREVSKLIDDTHQLGKRIHNSVLEANTLVKAARREERKERMRLFFSNLWIMTYTFRRRLRLVSVSEELEADQAFDRLGKIIDADHVKQIKDGKIPPTILEASGLKVYEIDGSIYFYLNPLEGETVKEKDARAYVSQLQTMTMDHNSNLSSFVAIISPPTMEISYQAQQALTESGIRLFRNSIPDTMA